MATTCCNHMMISGPARDITRFIRATRGRPAQYAKQHKKNLPSPNDSDYFCFNAFMPVPRRILKMGEFAPPSNLLDCGKRPHKRIICGSKWCSTKWGALCDVLDQRIVLAEKGNSKQLASIQFQFITFDGPPERWLTSVITRFPRLSFRISYSMKDQFIHGSIFGEKGKVRAPEIQRDYPVDISVE